MHIYNFFTAKKYKVTIISLILLIIGWGIYLYNNGLAITGPFIFGDELTYFSFARNIAQGKGINEFTQYGPLYPSLISLMFLSTTIIKTYKLIKLFNIVIFISTIIPAYLIGKILFTNRWLQILLPICTIFSPFSGLVYLIWAEPLYIALYYWTCYALCLHLKKPTSSSSFCLGVFLASLYFTKTAAGLITEIAAFITLIIHACMINRSQIQKSKLFDALPIIICITITVFWMLHYLNIGVSIVGYPSATEGIKAHLNQQGYITLVTKILTGSLYQLSYVIIGSYGAITLLPIELLNKWRQLNETERYFSIFVLITILGLICLSAIGMASYDALDYKMPNGRYFSYLFPLVIMLSLHLLFKANIKLNISNKTYFFFILIAVGISIFASPFYSRSPLAFNSMPDLSPIIYILDHKLVVWRSIISTPSFLLRITVPIIMLIFIMITVVMRKYTYTPLIICIIVLSGFIFGTYTEQYYIKKITEGTSVVNNIFIYAIKHHLPFDQIVFDKKFEISNIPFLTQFWWDTPTKYSNKIPSRKHKNKYNYFVSDQELNLAKLYSCYQYTIYKLN